MTSMGQGAVEAFIRELADRRFYGSLTLKFEAGKVVILKKEETLKPHELWGQPRNEDNAGSNHSNSTADNRDGLTRARARH